MSAAAAERPTVHLYYADAAALEAPAARDLVTDHDRAGLAPTAHPRRAAEHLAGRALLRFALQEATGKPARSHRLSVLPGGKPECVAGPALSLAHGGGVVVCALAPSGRIGVDVQFPVPGRRIAEIAARHFAAHETEWVGAGPPERFYMLWVLKEAYLKAVGTGIGGGLDALTCRIDPPRIVPTVAAGTEVPTIELYAAGEAFVAIAALGYRFERVEARCWNPLEGALQPAPVALLARSV